MVFLNEMYLILGEVKGACPADFFCGTLFLLSADHAQQVERF